MPLCIVLSWPLDYPASAGSGSGGVSTGCSGRFQRDIGELEGYFDNFARRRADEPAAGPGAGQGVAVNGRGPDGYGDYVRMAAERGWRVYLLGAGPGTAVSSPCSATRSPPKASRCSSDGSRATANGWRGLPRR